MNWTALDWLDMEKTAGIAILVSLAVILVLEYARRHGWFDIFD